MLEVKKGGRCCKGNQACLRERGRPPGGGDSGDVKAAAVGVGDQAEETTRAKAGRGDSALSC